MTEDQPKYLTEDVVRAHYGGISGTTLWRWVADPAKGFPRPIRVGRRRLFSASELAEFDTRLEADRDTLLASRKAG